MPEESTFTFMSIDQVQSQFTKLHQNICKHKGRVEIHDGESVCVLISKVELETLEQAIEILSNTSDVQKMARTIAAMTHAVAQGPLMAPAELKAN
jgi:hypothetical protein